LLASPAIQQVVHDLKRAPSFCQTLFPAAMTGALVRIRHSMPAVTVAVNKSPVLWRWI
jgi:hypothetical protein